MLLLTNNKVTYYFMILLLLGFLGGCASTSQVLKLAPKEGVAVEELNVLFVLPMKKVGNSDNTDLSYASTPPDQPALKLQDDISNRLPPLLKKDGLRINFATLTELSGVAPPSIKDLFPKETENTHLLIIRPLAATGVCHSRVCATNFTISLRLMAPASSKELWNARLSQGPFQGADWIESRNYKFIDDMAALILSVVNVAK